MQPSGCCKYPFLRGNRLMEQRATEVNSRDIDNAIAVMLESFIQSQKHQAGHRLDEKQRQGVFWLGSFAGRHFGR